MVFPSGVSVSESQVTSSVVNSIFRSGFQRQSGFFRRRLLILRENRHGGETNQQTTNHLRILSDSTGRFNWTRPQTSRPR